MATLQYLASAIGFFFVLAGQAIWAPMIFPIGTLACIGALAVACWAASRDPRVWHRRSLWLLLPFTLPILILAYGVIFNTRARSIPLPHGMSRALGICSC